MANLIIPVATAGVGYLVGGPTGARIGWMIGSAFSSSSTKIEQPAVGDLRVQTAQYGIPIPYVVGKNRVSGNVIWASQKRKYTTETTTGKGGGPTVVTTGYRQDMAILICKGSIAGITRVWANNKLIIDGRSESRSLVGVLYEGSNSQMPSPVIEAAEGVGNVPAYRGVAYIVIEDLDLGQSGAVPNFSFEVLGAQGF